MHNTTWAPNTMLSSRKKLKSQFEENFQTEGWTDLIHMYYPSGHGHGSYKRISQLRGFAVDNKKKIQHNSA